MRISRVLKDLFNSPKEAYSFWHRAFFLGGALFRFDGHTHDDDGRMMMIIPHHTFQPHLTHTHQATLSI